MPNIIPNTKTDFRVIKLIILSLFRYTIWSARLGSKFENKTHTPETIKIAFIQRTINTLTKFNLWAAFERMTE